MSAAVIQDIGVDPRLLSPPDFADFLDDRIQKILRDVEKSDVWSTIVEGVSHNPLLVKAMLKEIYLEIVMYQTDAVEAAIASIAQMPRSLPVAWVDEMLHHQVEEFDHGEMALRDYVGFGGDEAFARQRPMSPSAFAVAAIWRLITHKRDPFMYLGAVYLFDALTPLITQKVMGVLQSSSALGAGLEFISHHATADVAHAESIRNLIENVVEKYPGSKEAIVYGFEYFAHVYPLPCWESALRRAKSYTNVVKMVA